MAVVGPQPGLCLDGAHLFAAAGGCSAGVTGNAAGGREALTARGTWNKAESGHLSRAKARTKGWLSFDSRGRSMLMAYLYLLGREAGVLPGWRASVAQMRFSRTFF